VLALGIATILGLVFVPSVHMGRLADASSIGNGNEDEIKTGPIGGQYIVQLKDSTPKNSIEQKADQINATLHNETIDGTVGVVYKDALKGFAISNITKEALNMLAVDPQIKTIEQDHLDAPQAQYMPTGINRIDLDRASAGAKPNNREDKSNIDVAVVDGRVDPNHPDLNVFRYQNFVVAGGPNNVVANGISNHGTHVAGTVAARDNLGGAVGVVPGARIWSLAICPGTGPYRSCPGSQTLAAWDFIIANAGSIEIATESVGCDTCSISSASQTAAQNMINAGVTLFVAAGNTNVNADGTSYCGAPAAICVSALTDTDGKCGGIGRSAGDANPDDRRAAFSSYGSDVDIMSPGVWILSTWPGHPSPDTDGTPNPGLGNTGEFAYIGASEQGNYAVISGTSMATPLAAGVGALIKLQNPSFTPAQVKSNLLSNAYSQTLTCDSFGKGGLVSGANSKSSEKILYAGNY